MELKTTPYTEKHIALGAKMEAFGGYNMPIQYPTGIIEEHLAVCNSVGVFDVSHMGEFWVKGPKALEFLQATMSNDLSKVGVGKAQYACMPNEEGGIVDDMIIYHYEDEKYMLVPNAANIEKDWNWLVAHNTMGAEMENASANMAQLAIQGPKAPEVLQRITEVDLSKIPFYGFEVGSIGGCDDVIISQTGYTGEKGFELYFYPKYAEKLWDAIFEAGKPEGIMPCGLGARDTLRLEAGFNLYGNDMDDKTTPLEAGLGWITKFTEGKPFPAREMLEKQKAEGVTKKLVHFKMVDRGVPRQHYKVVDAEGNEIGEVTSGTMSPTLKIGIGNAYVKKEFSKMDSEIFIVRGKKQLKAVIAKPPFRA